MFQQNSYRLKRYWRWISNNLFDAWRLTDVALLFLLFSTLLDVRLSALITAVVALTKIFLILRKKYKKPLVFTKRVIRLYSTTAIVAIAVFLSVAITRWANEDVMGLYHTAAVSLGLLLVMTIFSWVIVMFADILMMPVESAINNHYRNDAIRILKSMPDLKIIGITGSYGKTSTKHYLQRILSESYDVLITPGSYNTPMGVIRTVREFLKPYNEVFICEMGAKQTGDIKEICDMVHPHIGIVTAVGPMHLETFKTIENVQATKFELVDSLPKNGLAVINNDFEMSANRVVTNVEVKRYGVSKPDACDFTAANIQYSPEGTTFDVITPDGTSFSLRTRLVGECNISNLLGAIVVALYLKVPVSKIQYAVADIEQVEHRLSIKRTPGGVTIIDDAFNSNPTGSRMAIDVLSQMKGGKRIIITPGMVELGSEQFNLNRRLGVHIADNVDLAIVVGQYNRDAIVEGLRSKGFDEKKLIIADSFTHAQQILQTIIKAGDTILYENDLPDTFK